ncbi:unnamed protein product [Dovyalis caffra]|uniref:PH domain-containing protein n=1 Tax=Dovyalis caffra TaxID=77055 RepID=A0AAV1RX01_9ROSI|nr:unnamed protein product [Dovyalis caffra]
MSQRESFFEREQPLIRVDMKINDMVGNGIFGILFKWVNYGKGWRPRWFVLQDGVLSVYRIPTPLGVCIQGRYDLHPALIISKI